MHPLDDFARAGWPIVALVAAWLIGSALRDAWRESHPDNPKDH